MCGLAGVVIKQEIRTESNLNKIKKAFKYMLIKADTRGGHATGFAMINNSGQYIICKTNKDALNFLSQQQTRENLNSFYEEITLLMGHTRYATKGSKNRKHYWHT